MTPEELLQELEREAQEAPRPELAPDVQRRLVQKALAEARHRGSSAPARSRAPVIGATAALLAVAAAALWLWVPREGDMPQGSELAVLSSGDRIHAASDAEYRIESTSPLRRQVELRRGTLLFDVQPLEAGASFEVLTHHARVRVVGTVFSVEVADDAQETTTVRVFEGEVRVVATTEVPVPEGRQWSSGAPEHTVAIRGGALANEARVAAGARRGAEPSLATNEPSARGEGGLPSSPSSHSLESGAAAQDPEEDPEERHEDPRAEVLPPPNELGSDSSSDRRDANPNMLPSTELDAEPGRSEEPPTLARVRAAIRAREWEEATQLLARASASGASGGEWSYASADVARASGDHAAAASAYEAAATTLSAGRRAQAAYQAASEWARQGDRARALSVIESFGLTSPGAPLAERALALEVRLASAAGQRDRARRAFEAYQARYPESGSLERLRGLVE